MHLIVGSENLFSDILASSINLHISKICLYRNLLITFGGECVCVWGSSLPEYDLAGFIIFLQKLLS